MKAIIVFAAAAMLVVCGNHPTHAQTSSAREMLQAEVRRRHAESAFRSTPLSETVSVYSHDSSRILPNLSYTWLTAGGSYHWSISAVVAEIDSIPQLLNGPEDWNRIVRGVGWFPQSDSEAIRGCAEFVGLFEGSGPPRTPGIKVLATQIDIDRLPGYIRGSLTASVSAPRVSRERSVLYVDVWVVETGETNLYRCTFNPEIPLTYKRVRTIQWIGFA